MKSNLLQQAMNELEFFRQRQFIVQRGEDILMFKHDVGNL